jgi:hypothetical protein
LKDGTLNSEQFADTFFCHGALIRRRQRLRFLHFHFLIAALEDALACFGAKDFGAALFTLISLPPLTHGIPSYFFISIGWSQHVTVPLPPRVTMTSAPHFAHLYLLPTWFAIFHLSF